MKKNFIIRNIIIAILVILLVAGISYYFIRKNGRNYEIEEIAQYNYFVVKQDNLVGVIDRSGNTVVEATYENVVIPNPEKAVFICYEGENTKILDENNQEILTDFESVEPIRLKNIASDLMYEKSVLTYKENEKFGLVNLEGKRITKAIYDEITGLPYKEGELLVKQNEKYGVINIKGNELVEIAYDQISVDGYYTDTDHYKYARYIVSIKRDEGYRYGYVDINGKKILEPEYNEVSRIVEISNNEEIYLICAKNGQYGLNKNDEQIIPNEYQSITFDENNSLLVIEKSKTYGIANLDGKILISPQYKQIDIVGIYLYAQNDQGTTVYNNDGTQANIDTNIAILNTTNEKYKIRIDNSDKTKYGLIGSDGSQLIEEKYSYMEYLYDDYFIVSNENSKLGIVDNKDNVKVEIQNDTLQKIGTTDLIQAVMANENITRIYSKDMTQICEMSNATIQQNKDYIKVYNQEETKYFNLEGKELKNTEVFTNNVLFAQQQNGKWGFANASGQMQVEATYDKVTEFNEYGFAAIKKDGKWGAINSNGEVIVEPVYEFEDGVEPSFISKYYQVTYGFGEVYYTDANNSSEIETDTSINQDGTTEESIDTTNEANIVE